MNTYESKLVRFWVNKRVQVLTAEVHLETLRAVASWTLLTFCNCTEKLNKSVTKIKFPAYSLSRGYQFIFLVHSLLILSCTFRHTSQHFVQH